MPDLPFAKDVNYWQTGHSSPDVWLARATEVAAPELIAAMPKMLMSAQEN